jgi:hypothetical protein
MAHPHRTGCGSTVVARQTGDRTISSSGSARRERTIAAIRPATAGRTTTGARRLDNSVSCCGGFRVRGMSPPGRSRRRSVAASAEVASRRRDRAWVGRSQGCRGREPDASPASTASASATHEPEPGYCTPRGQARAADLCQISTAWPPWPAGKQCPLPPIRRRWRPVSQVEIGGPEELCSRCAGPAPAACVLPGMRGVVRLAGPGWAARVLDVFRIDGSRAGRLPERAHVTGRVRRRTFAKAAQVMRVRLWRSSSRLDSASIRAAVAAVDRPLACASSNR